MVAEDRIVKPAITRKPAEKTVARTNKPTKPAEPVEESTDDAEPRRARASGRLIARTAPRASNASPPENRHSCLSLRSRPYSNGATRRLCFSITCVSHVHDSRDSRQLIRVGHSPDADDAFMFYALAKDKIPTGRYRFEHELVDIETLNRRAIDGDLDLTAVSVHAYAYLSHLYTLCSCGASMGDRYGPIVVARRPMTLDELAAARRSPCPVCATTAYLALRLCLGGDFRYVLVTLRSDPRCRGRGGVPGAAGRRRTNYPRRTDHLSGAKPFAGG